MPSPFPGVDPFLESQHYWPDFHSRFVNCLCEAISDALPDQYEARIEEQVEILELEPDKSRLIRPDVAIVRPLAAIDHASPVGDQPESNVATLESVMLPFPVMEEVSERWIQILHRPERSIVAVLELLSPTNKSNPGRGQYLAKRSRLFVEEIHLVEIDLLLGGERLPMGKPLPAADFYAFIARSESRPRAQVYSWTLRDRLPTIPIPLLKPDKDIGVDLGRVFATAYDRAKFGRSINYASALNLPMNEASALWVESMAKLARA